jgi:hypothetical protein
VLLASVAATKIGGTKMEALGALDVTLTPQDLTAIETAVPKGAAAGERYMPAEMARLDSERPDRR